MIHLTVIAHGNGIAAFRRHLPLWKAHNPDAGLVLVPTDDPIEQSESPWPVVALGLAQHSGAHSRTRLVWLLQHLAELADCSHFVIFEYDSFCLSPSFTFQKGFIGNLFANSCGADFLAPRYANPPWMIDRRSLTLMCRASKKWPDLIEQGEADRYLSGLAWLSNVPVLPHSPVGFSKGWITETDIAEMRKAIYGGATMIHGIKQKWTLEAALQFYDERPRDIRTLDKPQAKE